MFILNTNTLFQHPFVSSFLWKKLCELSISAAKHIATLFIALFENAFRDNKAYKELGPLKLISQALKSWQALSAIVLCVPEFAKTNMSTEEEMELNASKENYIYSVPKIVSQLSIRNLKKGMQFCTKFFE